jgi:RecJ-like exonuclease
MSISLTQLPPGACSKCAYPAERPELIGKRCTNQSAHGRCDGTYRQTLAASDWINCQKCKATGLIEEGRRCSECGGLGLVYARPQFP